MMNFILALVLLVGQAYSFQSSSKQNTIKLKTEQVTVHQSGIFKWNHFDVKLKSSRASLLDTIILIPNTLEVCIFNEDGVEVQRKKVADKKIYPDPDHTSYGFKSTGEKGIKKISNQELSIKIYRKFKSSSSNHKSTFEYDFEVGRYSLIVQYAIDGRVIKTEPIPFLVN